MAKSKIIKDLANSLVDTTTALKRAKVLISDLSNPKIVEWIDYEISGYPTDADIPMYRKVHGQLMGSYMKGSIATHMKWTNVSIPLGKMPESVRENLLSLSFYDGVEALKKLSENSHNSNGQIAKSIPADFFANIASYNEDPFMMITSAQVVVADHLICNIFSTIENKLLDILILLEKEFGCLDELDIDVTSKSQEQLAEINKQILLLVYNDNHVSIGDRNTIKDSTIVSSIND